MSEIEINHLFILGMRTNYLSLCKILKIIQLIFSKRRFLSNGEFVVMRMWETYKLWRFFKRVNWPKNKVYNWKLFYLNAKLLSSKGKMRRDWEEDILKLPKLRIKTTKIPNYKTSKVSKLPIKKIYSILRKIRIFRKIKKAKSNKTEEDTELEMVTKINLSKKENTRDTATLTQI